MHFFRPFKNYEKETETQLWSTNYFYWAAFYLFFFSSANLQNDK